jgi:hypothetical protein
MSANIKKNFLILSLISLSILVFIFPLGTNAGLIEFENPLTFGTIVELIDSLINFIFVIGLVVTPLLFMFGGFVFLTSGGDTSRLQKGKDIMIYTVIGFTLIFLVRGLVGLIKDILGIEEGTVRHFENLLFLGVTKSRETKSQFLNLFK